MGFTSLGLSAPILKAIEEKGYNTPSPIQQQAIPVVLEGKDVMAAAQTGTGKTAGFTLPILEKLANGPRVRNNHIRALILTPTRELAAQIQENILNYSNYLDVSSMVIFGGVKANPQMMKLRSGSDILVATPGRLLDLYNQNAVKFEQLEVLVLDEADRMLDMGFIRDIRKVLTLLPKKRQNLLFSATFSDEIRDLAKGLVNNPVEISVTPKNSTARTVEQAIYPSDKRKKAPMLVKMIQDGNWNQTLVFTRTKHGANRLAFFLNKEGITAAPIHGNKSQGARTRALADFKSGEIRVLVATDIAARGIDIPQLPQVVNFELPNIAEDYVHRIGRTGRAGEVGKAISLVCADETKELFAIERLTQQLLPRLELEGFEPTNTLPESKLDTRPIKAKKQKAQSDDQRSNEKSRNANSRNNQARRNKASENKASTNKPQNKHRRRVTNKNGDDKKPSLANQQQKANRSSGDKSSQQQPQNQSQANKPNGNKPRSGKLNTGKSQSEQPANGKRNTHRKPRPNAARQGQGQGSANQNRQRD